MINTGFRSYNYFTFGEEDAYGQSTLIKDENGNPVVQGTVKLCIYLTTQAIQENINYLNAQYVGVTFDKDIDETYVIQYGEEKLKVLYVNRMGRYAQVFFNKI